MEQRIFFIVILYMVFEARKFIDIFTFFGSEIGEVWSTEHYGDKFVIDFCLVA